MNDFLYLFKIQVNSGYGISAFRYNLKHNSKEAYGITRRMMLILIAAAAMIFSYVKMLAAMFKPLEQVGLQQMVLLLGVLVAFIFVLVFGFFYILGTMSFAKDNAFLASLPVKQGSIFASKFAIVMLGEFLISLPIMATPAIYYGIGMHTGVGFYIKLVFLAIFIPIIPLAAASILSLLLMRVASNIKRRDIFMVIGMFILVIGLMTVQGVLIKYTTGKLSSYLLSGAAGNKINIVAASVGRYFPPIGWAVNTLGDSGAIGIMNLLYFALTSLGAMVVAILISSKVYQRGAIGQSETSKKSRQSSYVERGAKSVTHALFILEWKTIIRTPIFAINSLFSIVFGPIIFILPSSGFHGNSGKLLYSALSNASQNKYMMLVVAGVLILFGLINPAAATPISREGKNFWMSKMIPVSPGRQIRAKFLAGYSISFLTVLTTGGMIAYVFKLSPAEIATGLSLSLCALISIVSIYVLIDLHRPKLIWDSPTLAIKQNMNVIISMIAGAIIAIVPGYIAYLMLKNGADKFLVFAVLMAVFIILAAAAYTLLRKTAEQVYRRI